MNNLRLCYPSIGGGHKRSYIDSGLEESAIRSCRQYVDQNRLHTQRITSFADLLRVMVSFVSV